MGLQFMRLQDTAEDKTKLYERIQQHLAENDENRIFYLVPEHMKFDMEFEVLHQIETLSSSQQSGQDTAMMRLQVFSFKRLAWYLMNQTVMQKQQQLTQTGVTMVLKKIMQHLPFDLKLFQQETNYLGFQEELQQLFTEFMKGGISSEDLSKIVEGFDSQKERPTLVQTTEEKIKELALLYAEFERYIRNEKLAEDVVYENLLKLITEGNFNQTLVIVEGFYQINAQEMMIIQRFMQEAREVIMVLTLDKQNVENEGSSDLFPIQRLQYIRLRDYAHSHHIPIGLDWYGKTSHSFKEGFRIIDHYLQQYGFDHQSPKQCPSKEKEKVQEVIDFWMCESDHVEAEQTANAIYHSVSQSQYRYCDIQILVPDITVYRDQLIPYLEMNDIPYFIDDAQAIEGHPLSRLLASLYAIYQYNWRYQDVFNFLRSELFMPLYQSNDLSEEEEDYRNMIDRTENVVLKNGYEGQKWWNDEMEWHYLFTDELGRAKATKEEVRTQQQANQLKSRLVAATKPLFTVWNQNNLTTHEGIIALYQFLKQQKMPNRLMMWAEELAERGDLAEAQQHEQAWQTFVKLLEEYEQLFGEETFDVADFFSILAVGFKNSTYHLTPPTLDSVTISGIDSQRVGAKKCTFLLGMSQHQFPRHYQNNSLLTEEDRDTLTHYLTEQQSLKLSTVVKNKNEKFIAYKLLLSAKEKLIISYPYNQRDEKDALLSPFFKEIQSYFELPFMLRSAQLQTEEKQNHVVLGNWRTQTHYLVKRLREHSHWTPTLIQLKSYLLKNAAQKEYIEKILSSLKWTNNVTPLSPELATALYGKQITGSVSSLELYNQDPFSYFLQYGLQLQERPIFELDSRLTGTYYHEVLQRYYDLKQNNDAPFDEILSRAFQLTDDRAQYAILSSNANFNYRRQLLHQTLKQFLSQMKRKEEKWRLENSANELFFNDVNAVEKQITAAGNAYHLRGVIDRLDTYLSDESLLFQVMDYKSSAKRLAYGDVMDGTALQLLTYLGVAWAQYRSQYPKKGIHPIGAFYNTVTSPLIELTSQKEWNEQAQISERLLFENPLNGVVTRNLDILHTLGDDPTLLKSIYNINLKKDGELMASVPAVSEKEFEWMVAFVTERIEETIDRIKGGDIRLSPIEKAPFLPTLNQYKSIAKFDLSVPGNHYRRRTQLTLKEFIMLLKKQQNEGGE